MEPQSPSVLTFQARMSKMKKRVWSSVWRKEALREVRR